METKSNNSGSCHSDMQQHCLWNAEISLRINACSEVANMLAIKSSEGNALTHRSNP